MSPIVIDNSIVLAWCLADEEHPAAERAMGLTVEHGAVVPGIWRYELWNALVVNERRARLSAEDARQTLADLAEMHIEHDGAHDESRLLALTRQWGLSAYDAAYLGVAVRRQLAIASLDARWSMPRRVPTSHWWAVDRRHRMGNRRCRSMRCAGCVKVGTVARGANVRTTLDIDEDALAATKESAKRQRKPAGKLASELMREALQFPAGQILPKSSGRHGFRPIPSGRAPVSNALVNKMRDELGA